MPTTIPQFLLPRGAPSPRTLQALTRRTTPRIALRRGTPSSRCASSKAPSSEKPRVLAQPDKFRPPSHPARRVVQTRNGRVVSSNPVNYPGPRLSEKEKEEQKHRQYPNMFPPEGTVMYKFLTSRWIHIWIAMVRSPPCSPQLSLSTVGWREGGHANSGDRASSPPWQPSPSRPTSGRPRRLRICCRRGRRC